MTQKAPCCNLYYSTVFFPFSSSEVMNTLITNKSWKMNQSLNWSCSKIEEIIAVLQFNKLFYFRVRTPCRWILRKTFFFLPFFLKGSQACSYREPSSSRTSIKFGGRRGGGNGFHACHVIGCHLSSFLSATAGFRDDSFSSRRGAEEAVISENQKRHKMQVAVGLLDLSQTWSGKGVCDSNAPTRVRMHFPAVRITSRWESSFTPAATCLPFSDTVSGWNALLSSCIEIFQKTHHAPNLVGLVRYLMRTVYHWAYQFSSLGLVLVFDMA